MELGAVGSGWSIAGDRHTGNAGGFVVEVMKAMIGKILSAGEFQMDALVELEDTLCISIIHSGGSGGADSGRHFYSLWVASGGIGGGTASRDTSANDENLRIINCVPMSNINPVEYLYGVLILMTGSHSSNPSRSATSPHSLAYQKQSHLLKNRKLAYICIYFLLP